MNSFLFLGSVLTCLALLGSLGFAQTVSSALFARLERVCLSVSIETDNTPDREAEAEVLGLAKTILQEAAFPFMETQDFPDDPRCLELTSGRMSLHAYGPDSYPGHAGVFETGLTVEMTTTCEEVPSATVYTLVAEAYNADQVGDNTFLYEKLKTQTEQWLAWFLADWQKARASHSETTVGK